MKRASRDWRWALALSLLAGAIAPVVAAFVAGARVGLGAGIIVVLIWGFFASGVVVERRALRLANGVGLAIVLIGYAIRVGFVAVALSWLTDPHDGFDTRTRWALGASLLAVLGWRTGLVLGYARSRVPIYDRPYEPPMGAS